MRGAADTDLIAAIRAALAAAADSTRAPGMQAYMKSAMPYLGVMTTPLRAAVRPLIAAAPLPTQEVWRDTVLGLWHGAQHREERYAAVEVVGHRVHRTYRTVAALPLYRELITTGAWWDLVDAVAAYVGALLPAVTDDMRRWARDDDMWLRRVAIISQIRRKQDTDPGLLDDCVTPNIGDRAFFIRKAIGWALRSYAWTDPAWVVAFVDGHPDLSGLSRREALKNVPR